MYFRITIFLTAGLIYDWNRTHDLLVSNSLLDTFLAKWIIPNLYFRITIDCVFNYEQNYF